MNKPHCSMPLLFGHRAEHVIRVHEVEEREATMHVFDLPQEVSVGKPICVLIEEIAPDRRCSRGVELPCLPRLRSISFSDVGDALVAGVTASGMWALASTKSGCPSGVIPNASHTGPRAGQNSSRAFLRLDFAIPAFSRAFPSRYS